MTNKQRNNNANQKITEDQQVLIQDWYTIGDDIRFALKAQISQIDDPKIRERVIAAIHYPAALPDPDGLAALAEINKDWPHKVILIAEQHASDRHNSNFT